MPPTIDALEGEVAVPGKLVKFGIGLARKAEVVDARMGGEEGRANLAGVGDADAGTLGRPFNPGVATSAGVSPRRSRRGRWR